MICGGVITGLNELGLDAQFVPLNDIVVNDKKISGNAQTRKQGIILQHGTILMDVDVDQMFDLLKVPDEKMKGKLIATIKERVTSIQHQTGTSHTFEEVAAALATGFANTFPNVTFAASELSDEEHDAVAELMNAKYSQPDWNNKR